MAKSKKATPATTATKVLATKRSGYKRKSNKRVNVLLSQLGRIARKAQRAAMYKSKADRDADTAFRKEFEKLEAAKKPVKKAAKKTAKAK